MQEALDTFNRLATEYLKDEELNPIVDRIPSEELFNRLDLSLPEEPLDEEKFEKALKELVFATPRTSTNAFFNQLFWGRSEKAVLGDLLAVLLNTSMYTYKAAGAMVGVEKIILSEVAKIIGWDQKSGGSFASGGSLTNFMSMLMARDAFNKDIRFKGAKENMTVYTSIESHYSIPKNAAFSGIGRDNVRYIPTDSFGKMDVTELEKTILSDIENGFHPVLINVTAGTTVLGAFDEVDAIADVGNRHKIWVHVDGAYCGSVIFSAKYKHLVKGLEKVDSFSFNAHKMIGAPMTCSLILVKDRVNLLDSFANEASYLYQTDSDEFNPGQTSLQCGRRNDALKFWTLWKRIGTKGLEELVDWQFELADIAREYVRNHPDYTLFSFDDSISICFSYKNVSSKKLCQLLYEHSELMVSFGLFRETEFVRLVTINSQNKKEDILNFFKKLEAFVEDNKALF